MSALIEASDRGNWASVNSLLSAGADVSLRDDDGYTAFLSAVARGYLDIVREFLFRRPEVICDKTWCNTTALMLAANYGYEEIVGLLLEFPETRVDDVDLYGNSAVWFAANVKHYKILDLLMSRSE